MVFVEHPFRLLLPLLLALAPGCDAARVETSVRAEQRGVQVTGDPAFFCDWSDEVSAFNKAAADYALGNRRTLDAWAVLNTQVVPGTMEDRLDTCWRGALYYRRLFDGVCPGRRGPAAQVH